MSVPLSGSGGYFTRIGHLGALVAAVNTFRATTIPAKVATLVEDLANGDPADAAAVNAALATFQAGMNSFLTTLTTVAQSITEVMAQADSPQTDGSLTTNFNYISHQMAASSQSLQANTVSLTTAATSGNIGSVVVVGSVLSSLGAPFQWPFAEATVGTITSDSQSGSATALRESINFVGQQAAASTTAMNYPAGSGDTTPLRCVDALQNQAGGSANFLNNGSFETFVNIPNCPDNWHLIAGTAGTQTLQSTTFFDGAYALKIVGDSSTLTALFQGFGSDTAQTLSAASIYAFCLWLKVDVVPAAGVLRVALTDGTNTVTTDASSNTNAVTKTLSAATTTYTPFYGVFRTPKAIPLTGLRLQVGLTTALSTGSNLFIDRLAFAPLTQLYSGGPSLAAFSSATPSIIGDSYTVTIANNRGGLLVSALDVLLPMRANGLSVPVVASSPTVSDSLFT